MSNYLGPAYGLMRCPRVALFAVVLYSLFVSPSQIGAAPIDSSAPSTAQSVRNSSWGPTESGPPSALIAWTWSQIFSPIRTILGSRARMIQFGAIGCCIALYIIWWRK
jgi:hypothetical protein